MKLAKKWAKHLPLGQKTSDAKFDLMKIFSKLFQGIGRLLGEYKIDLKTDLKLEQLPTRNIPEAFREQLKETQ